jgi:hypothetical protein
MGLTMKDVALRIEDESFTSRIEFDWSGGSASPEVR